LLMLDPALVQQLDLSTVLPIWRRKQQGTRVTSDLLGDYAVQMLATDSRASAEEVAYELLGANSRELAAASGAAVTEDELLLQVEMDRRSPGTPGARSNGGSARAETLSGLDTLSAGEWFARRLGLVSRPERLRRALQDWLSHDRTFNLRDVDDSLYVAMESRVADTIDFVVTGHTHLPRAMTYPGGCHYYNAGTWIRTLRLTEEVLADSEFFERNLWPMLQGGRMSALDEAVIPGPGNQMVPLVLDRTNAVRIRTDGARVSGDLLRVRDNGVGGISVLPEEDTTALEAR